MGIIIRKMKEEDLDRIMEIEKDAFTTPWTREAFLLEITKNQLARYIVAEIDDVVVGYGGIWLILDEGHITNIAVESKYRNIGAGKAIVEALISLCIKQNIGGMTLEVRESNIVAQHLYKNYGFIESGIRPNYYADDNENAIIMWKKL
ncbi:ribosomal protein S18-alanine N-acetyltransferase [Tissierella praeacuta]|uniref:[Ribosomal protein bS18]-alanine N-acetyltransferase n=2 Tax=Tissierella praeacuta TaxID=43131 RepID=A0A1M4XQ03_9FIRM|nr:ribosomal protein S18-alanine N-acetyltransferase [Tissierella praeacuta]SHE95312.1 ribosomal-protein-alanine N-acetyltransferase [Tissierella praeacuta DSM 18095]HAE91546.1 ribosomal-protein-alanine N-acetyltransferase [Tissierella sp.]MBU5256014.1 ribosomal protein S18-alanine N-acetyltransferase [Tissierella praeacuta]TCU75473.1 ribosomal-protein-alanine N-acetyltransferase [Tissierella praeacuta]SUO99785.1 ribosomal-protein-alanine N-acetyltransferase [Tissierella praeacuta]